MENNVTHIFTTVADLIVAGCRVSFNQRWDVDEGSYSSHIKTAEVKFPLETDRPVASFNMEATGGTFNDFPLDLGLKFTVAPIEVTEDTDNRKVAEYLFDLGVQLDITPCDDDEPLLTYIPKGSE